MIDIVRYQDIEEEIRVICIDGQVIIGHILSVDDDEESGFDEPGISIMTDYGRYVGIPQSEIDRIEISN